jgi:hypothetical protein
MAASAESARTRHSASSTVALAGSFRFFLRMMRRTASTLSSGYPAPAISSPTFAACIFFSSSRHLRYGARPSG